MPLTSLDLKKGMNKCGSIGIVCHRVYRPSTDRLTGHSPTKMSNFLAVGLCRGSKMTA